MLIYTIDPRSIELASPQFLTILFIMAFFQCEKGVSNCLET